MTRKKEAGKRGGRLRIGDDWNAITIIALTQQSPLKALAEFVENSIDARARKVIITRGREKGRQYLRIVDDGSGIPRDSSGVPDFQFVATHICDSLKRQLNREDRSGIQGEFGIGLLSFWTLGEELTLVSNGADGRCHEMRMRKGEPRYSVTERRRLFPMQGTEVTIKPLLPGIRHLSGEKIQWYLAAELRDRIRSSGVQIQVVDRQARTHHDVAPREFAGRLLHQVPPAETSHGEVYLELYISDPQQSNRVGLYRHGTRVIEDITALPSFQHGAWTTGCIEGIIDAPFLNLTPGTRTGILQDDRFGSLCEALVPIEDFLGEAIDEQKRAAEERASRDILRSIQRAFREALLALPAEEYDWFIVTGGKEGTRAGAPRSGNGDDSNVSLLLPESTESGKQEAGQKEFFDFPGPLYSVVVAPVACTMAVGTSRPLRAIPRDRMRRRVEENLTYDWMIAEGGGELVNAQSEIVTYRSPEEPGLTRLRLMVRQAGTECEAESLITVTDALMPALPKSPGNKGLPAYTFQRAPGELWRSRYDEERNLIVVNNSHRDFVYASRSKTLKLRYICRLYTKELVYRNFTGLAVEQLLERMVELSLYAEEHLR